MDASSRTPTQTAGETSADLWFGVVGVVDHAQRRLMDDIAQLGVGAAEFTVLHQLLRAPEHRMAMSQLARELSFTSGGFTKLADRMGRDGLIDRRNSAGDRRVVFATLTERGLDTALACERAYIAAVERHVLPHLSTADVAAVAESLSRLRDAVVATDPLEVSGPEMGVLSTPRDPELPDRRRRGRDSSG